MTDWKRYETMKRIGKQALLWLLCLLILTGCGAFSEKVPSVSYDADAETLLSVVPPFADEPYVEVNENQPDFSAEEKENTEAFESYSALDALGRCGTATANICPDLMPEEDRQSIGQVKPSGWHLVKYEGVDGGYLYNRCHLIGFQLAGENANEKNLITGTRYMNVDGMLPFENEVANYVRETENHVLYRVTPLYEGSDLVAEGVEMEAWSVEDEGEGVCFHVFVYNCQPGIAIDYATGESRLADEETTPAATEAGAVFYILNTNTKKFHLPDCASVADMKPQNKKEVQESRETLLEEGYTPCKSCNP